MRLVNTYHKTSIGVITKHPIIERYEQMLNGFYKSMPKNTWNNDKYLIYIIRYVLENKLGLSKDLIPKINRQVIKDHKLWGAFNRFNSIRNLINFVYPNQYNEFDFSRVPINYWSNIENIRKRLEDCLSQNSLTIEDIPAIITYDQLIKWGFSNPLKRHGDSPFRLIDELYPNRFKQTEFRSLPQGAGRNKQLLRKQFMDMLQHENIPFEEVPQLVTQKLLKNYRFSSALKLHDNSPSKFIINLFPDDFTHTDFRKTNGYWKNKDNIKNTITALVERHNIPFDSIPRYFTKSFLKSNGLSGLLHEYNGSPIQVIEKVYPGYFDITDFTRVPNRYWYSRDNRIKALRSYCKRKNIDRISLPTLNRAYFHKEFPRFISIVDRHYDSKFYLWIIESFPEYTFDPEEFKLYVGKDGQICDSKEELTIHNFLVERIKNANIYREKDRYRNELFQEVYIPDWVIHHGNRKIIIEYFGLYQSSRFKGYTEKANRKIEFFNQLSGYEFIAIFPEVLKTVGYFSLKELLIEKGIELKE